MTIKPILGNGDLSARSDAQLAHRFEQQLDAIWRLGDRDECSIKHIGHAMAALIATGDWRNAIDYDTPWGYYPYGQTLELERKHKRLEEKWDKVIDTIVRIDNLYRVEDRIIPETKFSFHIHAYLVAHWYDIEAVSE